MSDADLPPDPWSDPQQPYSSALDQARQLRLAVEDAPDLPAVLAAVSALSDEECRSVVLELGLDALWRRHHSGTTW